MRQCCMVVASGAIVPRNDHIEFRPLYETSGLKALHTAVTMTCENAKPVLILID